MSTVNPTPGVCQNPCSQCGDGGAGNASAALNSIGKLGATLAGVVSGRAVTTTASGVKIGPSGATAAQIASAPNMTIIIVVVVAAIALIFVLRK